MNHVTMTLGSTRPSPIYARHTPCVRKSKQCGKVMHDDVDSTHNLFFFNIFFTLSLPSIMTLCGMMTSALVCGRRGINATCRSRTASLARVIKINGRTTYQWFNLEAKWGCMKIPTIEGGEERVTWQCHVRSHTNYGRVSEWRRTSQ